MKPALLTYALLSLSLVGTAHAAESDKKVHGLNEEVAIPELNVTLKAKLDTGAATASISAVNIERFKRDGKPWVRFRLEETNAQGEKPVFEYPLDGVSKIKRRADDMENEDEEDSHAIRPRILLKLCMGNQLHEVEVNLTDRSAFRFPLLIGSKALKEFNAIVDPSLKYTIGKPSCPTPATDKSPSQP